jgi:hypothetical protein
MIKERKIIVRQKLRRILKKFKCDDGRIRVLMSDNLETE